MSRPFDCYQQVFKPFHRSIRHRNRRVNGRAIPRLHPLAESSRCFVQFLLLPDDSCSRERAWLGGTRPQVASQNVIPRNDRTDFAVMRRGRFSSWICTVHWVRSPRSACGRCATVRASPRNANGNMDHQSAGYRRSDCRLFPALFG